jgi:hypothetical protein
MLSGRTSDGLMVLSGERDRSPVLMSTKRTPCHSRHQTKNCVVGVAAILRDPASSSPSAPPTAQHTSLRWQERHQPVMQRPGQSVSTKPRPPGGIAASPQLVRDALEISEERWGDLLVRPPLPPSFSSCRAAR